jgi:hypothetical protein
LQITLIFTDDSGGVLAKQKQSAPINVNQRSSAKFADTPFSSE